MPSGYQIDDPARRTDGAPECEVGDACYRAVTETYRQLRALGESDLVSFQSAAAVYRHHHPEVPVHTAPYFVAEWIA